MNLSPSSINTYFECPKKFEYEHVLKTPKPKWSVFIPGSVMHAVAEHSMKEKVDGIPWDEDSFESDARASFEEIVHEEESKNGILWNNDKEKELEKSVRLSRFFGQNIYKDYEPALVEERFQMEVPSSLPVTGIMDLITKDGTAVDWKTSSRSWTQSKAERSIQRLIYQLHPQFNRRVFKFEVVVTANKTLERQTLVVDCKPNDAALAVDTVFSVGRLVQSGHFPRNIGVHCGNCPFVRECLG